MAGEKEGGVAVGPGWAGTVRWAAVLGIFLVILASQWELVGAAAETLGAEELACRAHNASCAVCLDAKGCYWCSQAPGSCHHYEALQAGTYFKYCSWGSARMQACWLNVEALVICCCVLGGVLLVALCVCCCKCRRACRRRSQRRFQRDEARLEVQDSERRQRAEERSAQRRTQTDAIRHKYGIPPAGQPYDTLQDE